MQHAINLACDFYERIPEFLPGTFRISIRERPLHISSISVKLWAFLVSVDLYSWVRPGWLTFGSVNFKYLQQGARTTTMCVLSLYLFLEGWGGMLYLSISHINRSQNESLGGGESFSDNSDWCILIAVWWLILEWLLLFLFIQVCYRWVSIALKCSPSMSFSY